MPYFDVGNPITNVMMISHERNFLQPREGKKARPGSSSRNLSLLDTVIVEEILCWKHL